VFPRMHGIVSQARVSADEPAPGDVLGDAVAFWSAGTFDVANDRLTDLSGNGHHAVFGSGANAPLHLEHDDTYLYHPAVATGSRTNTNTPHSSAIQPGATVEWRFDIAYDWETDTTAGNLTAMWGTGVNRWAIDIRNDRLRLHLGTSSGAFRTTQQWTSLTWPFSDGERGHVRITLDTDSGGNTVSELFTRAASVDLASDAAAWTSHGTRSTSGAQVWQTTGTPNLEVCGGGNANSLTNAAAKHYRFLLYDDTPAIAADFDPRESTEPHNAFTTDVTWTITRPNNRVLKASLVDRNVVLLGPSTYLEVADHADLDFGSSQDATVCALYRKHGTDHSPWLLAKKAGVPPSNDGGWSLVQPASGDVRQWQLHVSSGTNIASGSSPTADSGGSHLAAGVRDGDVTAYQNGTAGTSTTDTSGDLSNAQPLRVGNRSDSVASEVAFEFLGAAIFRRALTVPELESVKSELLEASA
jgi:hypothetical protein